jgi:itaconyl-CoA hydratase
MSAPSWESFELGRMIRSDAVTVTETHVVNWASLTGDWVPLHVNAEYARQTPFGERIAHGPLTLALALGLVVRTGVFGDSVAAWLGLDQVRLPLPVKFGDTVDVEAEVTERRLTSRPGTGLVVLSYTVRNQRRQAVMTFTSSFLLRCRDDSNGNGSSPELDVAAASREGAA